MKLLIAGQAYVLEEFKTVLVPHSNPIPLNSLKPEFRRAGNTIGKIPIQFLGSIENYKEFQILRYLFNNLPRTLDQFIKCHTEYRKLYETSQSL